MYIIGPHTFIIMEVKYRFAPATQIYILDRANTYMMLWRFAILENILSCSTSSSRVRVESRRGPPGFTCFCEAFPNKLGIKRHSPGVFLSLVQMNEWILRFGKSWVITYT